MKELGDSGPLWGIRPGGYFRANNEDYLKVALPSFVAWSGKPNDVAHGARLSDGKVFEFNRNEVVRLVMHAPDPSPHDWTPWRDFRG